MKNILLLLSVLVAITASAQRVQENTLTTNALDDVTSPLGLQVLDVADAAALRALAGVATTELSLADGAVTHAKMAASEQRKLGVSGSFALRSNVTWTAATWVHRSHDASVSVVNNAGRGVKYSKNGTFNAVNIPLIRTKSPFDADRVMVQIRQSIPGDAANTIASANLAIGSIQLYPGREYHTNVMVLLRDPSTYALKSLADADIDTNVFVGYYLVNSSGTTVNDNYVSSATKPATMDDHTYFMAAGVWSPYSGDPKFAIDLVNLTGPAEAQFSEVNPVYETWSTANINLLTNQAFGLMAPVTVVSHAGLAVTSGASWAAPSVYTTEGQAGWGEKFTRFSGSWNAIRLAGLGRIENTNHVTQWAELFVEIRATSGTGNGGLQQVIAKGSIRVNPFWTTLTNLIVPLVDPNSGAAKTLTDSDLTDPFFVGFYTRGVDGRYVSCGGRPVGVQAICEGNSFTLATSSTVLPGPRADTWIDTTDAVMPVDFLLLTTPTTSYVPAFSRRRLLEALGTTPSVLLPDYLYGVVGAEENVYLDALVPSANYRFMVSDSTINTRTYGYQQNERWTYTPASAITPKLMDFRVYDQFGADMVATATTTLKTAAANAGGGATKVLTIIGDSTSTVYVNNTVEAYDTANANIEITHQGTKTDGNGYKNEAVAGATYAYHYSNAASEFTDTGNFDFAYYLANNPTFVTPTHVVFNLGINDWMKLPTDSAALAAASAARYYAEQMITSIHAVDANIRIGIAIPIPPASDQDAMEDNLPQWRLKRSWFIGAKLFCDTFRGRTASQIYIIPIGLGFDAQHNVSFGASAPYNARTALTVARQDDYVHYVQAGGSMVGDQIYFWLLNNL